jgi:hypothetical protein
VHFSGKPRYLIGSDIIGMPRMVEVSFWSIPFKPKQTKEELLPFNFKPEISPKMLTI